MPCPSLELNVSTTITEVVLHVPPAGVGLGRLLLGRLVDGVGAAAARLRRAQQVGAARLRRRRGLQWGTHAK